MSAQKRRTPTEVLAMKFLDIANEHDGNAEGYTFDDLPPRVRATLIAMADHVTNHYEPKDKTANRGR